MNVDMRMWMQATMNGRSCKVDGAEGGYVGAVIAR